MKTIALTDGTLLKETIAKIQPTDNDLAIEITKKLIKMANLTNGQDLGIAPTLNFCVYASSRYTENEPIPEVKPATVICCGDHGVSKMQVSAYPQETTLHMTTNYLISKGAAANAFANLIGSNLLVADFGINAETEDLPGLLYRKIAYGTDNSSEGPAMSREQAITAIEEGIKIANECAKLGFNVIIPGEMGISNTTASAAIVASICKLTPEQATGRGTNISDERLKNKQKIVAQILDVNKPNPDDGIDVMHKVGGFELAAITGLIIGAAANKITVFLDGLNATASALIAAKICPVTKYYFFASHIGAEPAHIHAVKHLALRPFMKMDFRLGEGLGSSLACDILSMFIKGYNNLLEEYKAISPCDDNIENPDESSDEDSSKNILNEIKEIEEMIKNIVKNPSDIIYEEMPDTTITLSDKTFNYYTMTMPDLDNEAMENCQKRIDNLAKPIYSLGKIEQIAVELAGIMQTELPDFDCNKSLLCIGYNPEKKQNMPFLQAFTKQANAKLVQLAIAPDHSNDDYFEFGRTMGEHYSLYNNVIGLSILTADGSNSDCIAETLKDEKGNLKYSATEFLQKLPAYYRPHVSTFLGVMLSAAHNHTMIVLDDEFSTIIANYAIELCSDLQPFILPITPEIYQLNAKNSNGIDAAIGLRLVDSALHMLNDMKTFGEAQVAVANDGPGAGRQS